MVGIGYVRPVQFLDHLTVITTERLSLQIYFLCYENQGNEKYNGDDDGGDNDNSDKRLDWGDLKVCFTPADV